MTTVQADLTTSLDGLKQTLRDHAGLTGKQAIRTVSDYIDTSDPVRGPGDDGAVVATAGGNVVACGEALFPPFVEADPYGAGIAAVLANVNDVAAMGGIPQAIVNTIVGTPELAAEAMRGMCDASKMYDVPIVGGHITELDGPPALSAFAIGEVQEVLSMAYVEPGQKLILTCSLDGHMRDDFPFFTTLDRQGPRLAHDIRLLHEVANLGLVAAAKDVSMAGPIGSLAMLLEFRNLGTSVDLDLIPAPADVPMSQWLISFPTYAFWLAVASERADQCVDYFRSKDLEAAVVGEVTSDPVLALAQAGERVEVLDLSVESITGLWATGD